MTDNKEMDFCGELCKYAEDIINRQKAEIERLTDKIESISLNYDDEIGRAKAEIERLKPFRDTAYEVLKGHYAIIKADILNVFEKRLVEKLMLYPTVYRADFLRKVSAVKKEMVGDGYDSQRVPSADQKP